MYESLLLTKISIIVIFLSFYIRKPQLMSATKSKNGNCKCWIDTTIMDLLSKQNDYGMLIWLMKPLVLANEDWRKRLLNHYSCRLSLI